MEYSSSLKQKKENEEQVTPKARLDVIYSYSESNFPMSLYMQHSHKRWGISMKRSFFSTGLKKGIRIRFNIKTTKRVTSKK